MKKSLLLLFVIIVSWCSGFAQATMIVKAPLENTTTQVRAPNGTAAYAYLRACALVLQTELTNIPNSTSISIFGFTVANTTNMTIPVTGNFTLYLQNTTDVSYSKGTTWTSIISGMSTAYASIMTIPQSATTTSVVVTLSSPFVYTGGGLYVAYDWASAGPFSTVPCTFHADGLALNPGCASLNNATIPPATLGTTNFRPSFLFGFANPYTNDVQVVGVECPGKIAATLNTPHVISAMIRNASNAGLSNIPVNVNVAGANTYVNTLTITSLAAGASTLVSFPAFNPLQPGTQTVAVTVPLDQVNNNNLGVYPQLVTCDTWCQNPGAGTYTYNGVGFGTGAGILCTPYTTTNASTLLAVRGAISTSTGNPGNNVYGVLLSSTGVIIATTNTITITNAMQGTTQQFNFALPQNLAPTTTYYYGFAQTANVVTAYYPAGTQQTFYLPANAYWSTGIGGGPLTLITQNYGYFGLEAVFQHTLIVTAISPTITCGSTGTINALSPTNYSWSTGATTPSIVISPTITTNYTITATNTLGCVALTTVAAVVAPIPVTINSSTNMICAGDQIILTGSGATNYTWTSPAGIFNTTSLTENPVSNTNYVLTGSDPNGCSAQAVLQLTVNPLPIVNISTNQSTICLGNSSTLTASGNAANYLWSTGPTTNVIVVNPNLTTTYSVAGQSGAGCIKVTSITVNVNSFTPGITPPSSVCAGQFVTLAVTGASTLQWSTGQIFSSIQVTPAVTTLYTVTALGTNGCIGNAATTVSVYSNPTVTAISSRTAICKNENTKITASGATTYSWSTGANTSSVVVSPTLTTLNTFTVTGFSPEGCSHTIFFDVRVSTCAGLSEEAAALKIKLYPNPSTGAFVIETETEKTITMRIYNLLGVEILQEFVHDGLNTFSIEGQPADVYFVKISDGHNQLGLKKLVIE
jgi:hypothetical protein